MQAPKINCEAVRARLKEIFSTVNEEHAVLVLLDDKGEIIDLVERTDHEPHRVQSFQSPELSAILEKTHAASFILAHNHALGTAIPSDNDRRNAQALWLWSQLTGESIADILIYSDMYDEQWFSWREFHELESIEVSWEAFVRKILTHADPNDYLRQHLAKKRAMLTKVGQ